MKDDTVSHILSVIRIDTLIFNERHVKKSIDDKTALLREEDVFRLQLRAVDGGTCHHLHVDLTILLRVKITVTSGYVDWSWVIRWGWTGYRRDKYTTHLCNVTTTIIAYCKQWFIMILKTLTAS